MSTIQWVAGIVLILACTGMVMAYVWDSKFEQRQEVESSEAVEVVLKDLQSRVNALEVKCEARRLGVLNLNERLMELQQEYQHQSGVLANWEGTWKALFEPVQKECEK